jgi:outer membrane protein
MNRIFLIAIVSLLAVASLNAQKFGYVNSSQLLLSLPEVKTADQQLEVYQKDLIAKGEQMVKKFEANYNAYMTKVNSGEFSQIQMQKNEEALSIEQQAIQKFEVEVQNSIAAKKQELYQPILNKVQAKVNELGKEMNYTFVFDASIGGILFAQEADDLMPLLKKRLGVN